jgi:hypothetical protein
MLNQQVLRMKNAVIVGLLAATVVLGYILYQTIIRETRAEMAKGSDTPPGVEGLGAAIDADLKGSSSP